MPHTPSDARHTEQIEAHGLRALRLKGGGSEALVYLHGGHVASFRSAQHGELLWTSARAVYAPGKAIRGGVRSGDRLAGPAAAKALEKLGVREKR